MAASTPACDGHSGVLVGLLRAADMHGASAHDRAAGRRLPATQIDVGLGSCSQRRVASVGALALLSRRQNECRSRREDGPSVRHGVGERLVGRNAWGARWWSWRSSTVGRDTSPRTIAPSVGGAIIAPPGWAFPGFGQGRLAIGVPRLGRGPSASTRRSRRRARACPGRRIAQARVGACGATGHKSRKTRAPGRLAVGW